MREVTVGEIATQVRGVSYGKTDVQNHPASGCLPVLRANNITDDGLLFEELVFVKVSRIRDSQLLRAGDIVIAASSGSLSVVGKAAQVGRDLDAAFGAFCKVVRPGPKVHPAYLGHFFRTPAYRSKISSLAAGANINNLRSEHIDDLPIPLPPLPEQRRIAAILDQADALRRLRRQSLSRLSKLGQAIFFEMFGDPILNSKQLPTSKLGQIGTLDRGKSQHRPRNDPALLGGRYPLIQTGDVARSHDFIRSFTSTYSEIGLRQSKLWRRGTLCITIAANIADTAILDFDACFPDSVVGFDGGSASVNFFVHSWLKITRGELERVAPAVAQKNINLAILRDLDIIAPSKDQVEEYYRRMESIFSQRGTLEVQEAGLDRAFASLQHRAFRGEL